MTKSRDILFTREERKKLKKIGRNIRRIREDKELTLQQVVNVRKERIKNWQNWAEIEAGNKNITVLNLLRICSTLKVKPHEIFEGV